MNIIENDLDLDGRQAMLREDLRERAWRRQRLSNLRDSIPSPTRRPVESGRPIPEPAWD